MNVTVRDIGLTESKRKMVSGAYLHNAWYVAAWSDDLAEAQLLPRTILHQPVVLYRKADGHVAALEDRCAHRFAPLSMGKVIKGDIVQCPYHGLEYDPTGACVLNPHGTKNIPSRARVRSYPTIEKHKAIWIWMGDQPADPAKVPDFSVLDNVPELHATKRDRITIKANYELIIDNLLDLSHTSYLHEGILGNSETVESDITVEQDGDDIVVERHASGVTAPGMFAMFLREAGSRRQVHQHALDGAQHDAAGHRHLRGRREARKRHRLSRHPPADAGDRQDLALLLHGGALQRADAGRQAECTASGEDRDDAPLCLRGAGCAGDRGAAAHHR